MMQSKRSRFRGTLHTNNSIRYSDNCIRRNSLQIGNMPSSRNSLSPNLTTDVVVMLENNLNGRPRCYTTSATTLVTNVVSSNSTVTENSFKIPLISIDKPGTVRPLAGSRSGSCTSIEPTPNTHLNGNNNSSACNNKNYDTDVSLELADQPAGSPVPSPVISPLLALPAVTVVLEEDDPQHQPTGVEPFQQEDTASSPDTPTVPTFHYHPNLLQQRCGEMDEVVLLTDATKRETCI
uniref:Uncharacterized protein n=1 Tax=Anopheles culicifacies TaxID=139723 RepID=A0A182MSS1_9DIPT